MSQVLEDLETLARPVLEAANMELVDVTYQKGPGGWTVCFYLDKPGGITLDDCQDWSGRLGALIDERDLIPHAYSLEVSSPGLDRPLKRISDFQRFSGERVHVKLYAPQNGQKNFHGVLLGATEDKVQIRSEQNEVVEFELPKIARAKLDPVIEF